MKILMVLVSALAVAHAGVRTLSPREEQDVLQKFQQLCSGGGGDGSNGVYCKISTDNFQETKQHTIQVKGDESSSAQTIYIQPPSNNYNHQIKITGSSGSSQKATIYVLPQKNTHTIDHTYEHSGKNEQSKPTVYFLKGNSGNNGGNSGGSGNFGGNGNTGGNFGSVGNTGGNFGSVGNTGGNFGSAGNTGGNFGSVGNSGGYSGSVRNTAGNFGSVGNAGGNFGSVGSTGGYSGRPTNSGGRPNSNYGAPSF